jgi:hypothetical protein
VTRKARYKTGRDSLFEGTTMDVHGDMLPANGRYAERYHVTFTSGLLCGCCSTVSPDEIEFIPEAK